MIPNCQRWFLPPSGGGVSVLQPWYDSLLVKPSEGLWTDLKILANGMNTDGDWGEADLISVHAGLETDEQRLRPFKTTSGDDFTLLGAPTLSIEGFDSNSNNGIDSKWNPVDNGVKYKLNDCYMACYGVSKSSTGTGMYFFGASDAHDILYNSNISTRLTTTTLISDDECRINGIDYTNNTTLKTGLLDSVKRYYNSIKRINSTTVTKYINGNSQNITANSTELPPLDFYILGINLGGGFSTPAQHYSRAVITGSSLIDSDRVAARLNTFFASRGLSIANY